MNFQNYGESSNHIARYQSWGWPPIHNNRNKSQHISC